MIAIVDYGVGNLFSLKSSVDCLGYESTVTGDAEIIRGADRIILPGVGAFRDAISKLKASGLDAVVKAEAAKGKPLLGICLGMQMLFEKSYEYGCYDGLGLLKGNVVPMGEVMTEKLKLPQMGWNALHFDRRSPLLRYINEGDYVYFVHSYCAVDLDSRIAYTDYGGEITAAVEKGNVMGTQFHPEKSGKVGLQILRVFCEGGEL